MVRANRQFFVVKIDKKLQEQKRNNLVSKNIGYLGIKHSAQDDDDTLNGVRVWDVEVDSPAYDAAFKHNDIIKEVQGVKVSSYAELSEQISLFPPNVEIEIKYINSLSVNRDHISTKKVILGERKFEIFVAPQIIDFQFNLQFGEIVEIGKIAGEQFPDAKLGDMLIFHHAVEHKPRTDGDTMYHDYHLIETDENGDEYRIVNFTNELFGVLKLEERTIIPYKNFIFCHQNIRKASMQVNSSGIWVPDAWEKSIEEMQDKIDELTATIQEVSSSSIMKERTNETNYKKKEEIKAKIEAINKEKKEISRMMAQKKLVELTVLFIHPKTCEEILTEISAGDTLIAEYNTLYPLDMYGQRYTLLRKDYIEAVIFKN